MSPLLMYVWAPIAGVIVVFTTIPLFRPFYGRLTNPLFSAPYDRELPLLDKVSLFFEMWGIYLVAVFVISLSISATPYIVKFITLIAQDKFTVENVRQFVQNNESTLMMLLQASLCLACFIVILARVVSVTYSDFLVDYLVFNTIVLISSFLIVFPLLTAQAYGEQFFDYFTDHYFRPGLQNYILSATLYSLATVLFVESFVGMMRKISVKWEKPIKSSFNWTNRLIQLHEAGEQFHTREGLIANSEIFFRDTFFGNELKGMEPQPFVSLDILTLHGTEAIFTNILNELLYWYANYHYGIKRGYLVVYHKLKEQEQKKILQGKDTIKIDQRIQKLMIEISKQVKEQKDKLAEISAEELKEMAKILAKEAKELTEEVKELTEISPEQLKEMIDEKLRSAAQVQLSKKTRIVGPSDTCKSIHRLWDVDKKVFRTQSKIGNQRYMILNNSSVFLGYTLPYREEDCVNAGFVMRDLIHRIQTYISHFDDLWARSDPL